LTTGSEKITATFALVDLLTFEQGPLYVLARHHKMCKLANWSHLSNITFCSHAPGHATEEQAKLAYGESQAPIGAPARKRLTSSQCSDYYRVCPSQEK
jgi:hypothetical protein